MTVDEHAVMTILALMPNLTTADAKRVAELNADRLATHARVSELESAIRAHLEVDYYVTSGRLLQEDGRGSSDAARVLHALVAAPSAGTEKKEIDGKTKGETKDAASFREEREVNREAPGGHSDDGEGGQGTRLLDPAATSRGDPRSPSADVVTCPSEPRPDVCGVAFDEGGPTCTLPKGHDYHSCELIDDEARPGLPFRSHEPRTNEPSPDPVAELSSLMKEAGVVPYLHHPNCAVWRKQPCDLKCGPRTPATPRACHICGTTTAEHGRYCSASGVPSEWVTISARNAGEAVISPGLIGSTSGEVFVPLEPRTPEASHTVEQCLERFESHITNRCHHASAQGCLDTLAEWLPRLRAALAARTDHPEPKPSTPAERTIDDVNLAEEWRALFLGDKHGDPIVSHLADLIATVRAEERKRCSETAETGVPTMLRRVVDLAKDYSTRDDPGNQVWCWLQDALLAAEKLLAAHEKDGS